MILKNKFVQFAVKLGILMAFQNWIFKMVASIDLLEVRIFGF